MKLLPTGTALLVGLAGRVTAFWRMPCPSRIVQERVDPIVNPGGVSNHVHTVSGGSGFGKTMDYAQARAADCSSCPIKQDLSNYWTPLLYYRAENGSFISVPQAGDGPNTQGGMTVYYLQRPGPDNDELKAFPEDFRMLAGDASTREFAGDFAAQAVSYVCLDYNGPPIEQTNEFPNRNCPDGLRAQIFFPSCWNGKDLDSDDHKSHMSYPTGPAFDNGRCPDSHPVHLISIFYEVIYQTNLFADDWYGDSQPFVWANGDTTGYSFHGDFLNGWDIDVLQAATDDCLADSGVMEACQHFEFFDTAESQACKVQSSVDEQVTGVLEALPGVTDVNANGSESDVEADTSDPEVKADDPEPDVKADDLKSNVTANASESDVESDTSESDVKVDDPEPDVKADDIELDVMADISKPDVKANDFESDVKVNASKPDVKADDLESDVKAADSESRYPIGNTNSPQKSDRHLREHRRKACRRRFA